MSVMFKKEDGSQQKNIYQSHLVRLGPAMVKFKTNPMPSKYPKGSATHYAYIVLSDQQEYCLAVEPEVVKTIEAAPKDEWVRIVAGGSAEEPASIRITAEETDGPPDNLWPEEAPPVATAANPDAVARAVEMTVRAVTGLRAEGVDVDPTPIYSTHFIQCNR